MLVCRAGLAHGGSPSPSSNGCQHWVIRRNPQTSECSLDLLHGVSFRTGRGPKGAEANQCYGRDRGDEALLPRLPETALHRAGGRVLRVDGREGFQDEQPDAAVEQHLIGQTV